MKKLNLKNLLVITSTIGFGAQKGFSSTRTLEVAKQDAVHDSLNILETECSLSATEISDSFKWGDYEDEFFWSLMQNIQDRVAEFCIPPELDKMQSGTKVNTPDEDPKTGTTSGPKKEI